MSVSGSPGRPSGAVGARLQGVPRRLCRLLVGTCCRPTASYLAWALLHPAGQQCACDVVVVVSSWKDDLWLPLGSGCTWWPRPH